jgi:hypothetical protein
VEKLWILEEIGHCRQNNDHHAGVAQHKGNIIRKNQTTDKVARGTSKRQMFGKRQQAKPNCKKKLEKEQSPHTAPMKREFNKTEYESEKVAVLATQGTFAPTPG